jgi:hypothetical protein
MITQYWKQNHNIIATNHYTIDSSKEVQNGEDMISLRGLLLLWSAALSFLVTVAAIDVLVSRN